MQQIVFTALVGTHNDIKFIDILGILIFIIFWCD